jgi:hypothetical protein
MAQRARVHVLECHVYRVSVEECIVQVDLRTREYSRAVLYSVAARCTLLQRVVLCCREPSQGAWRALCCSEYLVLHRRWVGCPHPVYTPSPPVRPASRPAIAELGVLKHHMHVALHPKWDRAYVGMGLSGSVEECMDDQLRSQRCAAVHIAGKPRMLISSGRAYKVRHRHRRERFELGLHLRRNTICCTI